MVKKIAVLLLFCLTANGCILWPAACDPDAPNKNKANLGLNLIVKRPDILIRTRSAYIFGGPVMTNENQNLGDTVRIFLYGDERYYRKHIHSIVMIDSQAITLDYAESDSTIVRYTQPDDSIQVLKKEACSPVRSGIRLDSVVIEISPDKVVTFIIE